ncbi:MAG: DUF1329 domain-containing protein [Deltaproteobacteria bacterium]|nr:DUF1329 domain-containing protein [Deltaproteobacteria bacterium]MBI3391081.1 DUF1329 domain-containing protein [Deltaproteobacteria bacterium]
MTDGSRRAWICGVATALLLGTTSLAPADVEPGQTISKDNIDKVADLVSPGVKWCIERGMQLKIVPYKKIEWDKAFREATEKNAGQVKLAPDGRSIEGHITGLPFPKLDANDPQIALKIMWNYEYKPYVTDDSDARNFDADTGPVTDGPMAPERHYLLDHLRVLFYTSRLYVDPKPELPNPDKVRYKTSLHPILEPFDLKGIGLTAIRYLDPDHQDDTWLYLPTLRRVRRLSSSQRSDSLFGQDTDVDSYSGYAGQIGWFDWKYLGEKTMLGAFHAEKFPVEYCPGSGDFVFCDNWEKREVYVIDGTPKQPQYAYGKRVLFIDKESYLITFTDIYDRAGQLQKVWLNQYSFRKHAPTAGAIEYPDEMPFNPSITMVDVQLRHATRAALPSAKYAAEQGWYFNQGAKTGLTEEFFTIAHLIASGT